MQDSKHQTIDQILGSVEQARECHDHHEWLEQAWLLGQEWRRVKGASPLARRLLSLEIRAVVRASRCPLIDCPTYRSLSLELSQRPDQQVQELMSLLKGCPTFYRRRRAWVDAMAQGCSSRPQRWWAKGWGWLQ